MMGTRRRSQLHVAIGIEPEAAVAHLAVDPGILAVPAQESAERGVGLVEIAALLAPVAALAAVTGEPAIDEVACAPVHAGGQRRACAVIVVGVAVPLEIATQVGPPVAAIAGRLACEV